MGPILTTWRTFSLLRIPSRRPRVMPATFNSFVPLIMWLSAKGGRRVEKKKRFHVSSVSTFFFFIHHSALRLISRFKTQTGMRVFFFFCFFCFSSFLLCVFASVLTFATSNTNPGRLHLEAKAPFVFPQRSSDSRLHSRRLLLSRGIKTSVLTRHCCLSARNTRRRQHSGRGSAHLV